MDNMHRPKLSGRLDFSAYFGSRFLADYEVELIGPEGETTKMPAHAIVLCQSPLLHELIEMDYEGGAITGDRSVNGCLLLSRSALHVYTLTTHAHEHYMSVLVDSTSLVVCKGNTEEEMLV